MEQLYTLGKYNYNTILKDFQKVFFFYSYNMDFIVYICTIKIFMSYHFLLTYKALQISDLEMQKQNIWWN
jgi:hypothetical protein